MTSPLTKYDEMLAQIPVDRRALDASLASLKPPSTQYILFMTPRTGSSWLRDLLRSTNVLGWPEEWYNTMMLQQFAEALSVNSLEAYVELSRGRGQSSNGVYGVTMTWHELSSLWPDAISNPRSSFFRYYPLKTTTPFMIYRRDIVAQAVSFYRMMTTGAADLVNFSADQQAEAERGFHYNEVSIRKCINRIRELEEGIRNFFSVHDLQPRTLIYEDMTAASEDVVAKYFVDTICPGDQWQSVELAESRHRKLGSDKTALFAERFKLDNNQLVEDICAERDSYFEDAHYFEVPKIECAAKQRLVLSDRADAPLSVIIPVYSAFASTTACLKSVIEGIGEENYRIIVIYDAGPNSELEEFLDDLARMSLIELHKNSENLGFVASVNSGFELSGDDNVIILNSDTLVPPGWADRMMNAAKSDPKIATITPFTNNGEICSFPTFCGPNTLPKDMSAAELDSRIFKSSPEALSDIPTGVGFCMYISRAALNELGPFNVNVFGRGYGEENDFCRRAARRGWRNVLQHNLFVYHKGNASFGDERRERLANAVAKVEKLNPGYNYAVQMYVRSNPLQTFRFRRLLEYFACSENPIVLIVGHGQGGGTRRFIHEIRTYFDGAVNFFWIEPSSPGWVRLLFPSWGGSFNHELDLSKDSDALMSVLRFVGVDKIHINHIAGMEALVRDLIDDLKVPYVITLHDYYFIGVNPTLTDRRGLFDPSGSMRELSSTANDLSLTITSEFFEGAEAIWAPSVEAADIYKSVLPKTDIMVAEHLGTDIIQTFPPVNIKPINPPRPFKVCVLGALGLEKGADVLEAVAILAKRSQCNIEFELLGYAYRKLDTSIKTHGAYKESELQTKLEEISPDIIWFPCQWPETYSYTLTAALDSGLPVIAPALGAFKSRTNGRPFTWCYDHTLVPGDQLSVIQGKLKELSANSGASIPWVGQPKRRRFYKDYRYNVQERRMRDTSVSLPPDAELDALLRSEAPEPHVFRSIVMSFLWRVRANRLVARVWFNMLPNDLRAFLKRVILG